MYFSDSYELRQLEKLMRAIPNFRSRGHGVMILHRYEYTERDCDCLAGFLCSVIFFVVYLYNARWIILTTGYFYCIGYKPTNAIIILIPKNYISSFCFAVPRNNQSKKSSSIAFYIY